MDVALQSLWRFGLPLLVLVGCTSCHPAGPLAGTSASGDSLAIRGENAYERGDYETAAELLQRAIEKGTVRTPPEVVHTALGNVYNELERFDEAIAAHKRALEINPRCFEAWNNLGVCYRLTDNLEEAANCYHKALDLNPSYAEAHASLGVVYIVRDEPDQAIVSLEKAVECDRQLAVAHANLALAYAMVGRFDDAEGRLKRAVSLGYKNGPLIKERIQSLRQLDE